MNRIPLSFATIACTFCLCLSLSVLAASPTPLTEAQAKEFELSTDFYKKATEVEGILIATSDKVSDYTHKEAAFQFKRMMDSIQPEIAERIRTRKVLCLIVGHSENVSEMPQFTTNKTGEDLDFYNWRKRGFLAWPKGQPTVLFAEEDVMEYEGGNKLESILIHEFGHVIHGAGFDQTLQERLTQIYASARKQGLWNDGRAAQRFKRVKGDQPVLLLDALAASFPHESRELLKRSLDGGDILVNDQPSHSAVKVTEEDKVDIVFGGPKRCYAGLNRSEYWSEVLQCWYNTNRTMDHDHNHIHTRAQLLTYDPVAAELCRDVLGDQPLAFVSPRERAGQGHLKGYDPITAPVVVKAEHIKNAAADYYDTYWKAYWSRLYVKHELQRPVPSDKPLRVFILAGQSNMEGHGNVPLDEARIAHLKKEGHYDRDKRNHLQYLAHEATDKKRFRHLLTPEGEWVVRDDVWVAWNREGRWAKEHNTTLTVGLGASERQIGPELMFGHILGNHYEEPVLLIKTAWGGKSLGVDFRPPSAGMPPDKQIQARLDKINEQRKKKNEAPMSMEDLRAEYGHYYRQMITDIDHTLAHLKQHFPAYDEQVGYELAGFVWFQGWNDGADLNWANEYTRNFKHLVQDVRKKYGPLPVVIGTSGFGKHAPNNHDGWVNRLAEHVEPAQLEAARQIENCEAFETGDCLIPHPDRTSNGGIHHWFNSAETYYLIGEGMGKTMQRLLRSQP